jgi:hypothetical protein
VKLFGQIALIAMIVTFTAIGALVTAITIMAALGLVDIEVSSR